MPFDQPLGNLATAMYQVTRLTSPALSAEFQGRERLLLQFMLWPIDQVITDNFHYPSSLIVDGLCN